MKYGFCMLTLVSRKFGPGCRGAWSWVRYRSFLRLAAILGGPRQSTGSPGSSEVYSATQTPAVTASTCWTRAALPATRTLQPRDCIWKFQCHQNAKISERSHSARLSTPAHILSARCGSAQLLQTLTGQVQANVYKSLSPQIQLRSRRLGWG